jgi:uncharacterized membrane protein
MPYKWLPPSGAETRLHLWPHRSLTSAGFVTFIAISALVIAAPLFSLIGKPVLWGLLPFLVAAIAGIWFALRKSDRDREIIEVLTLTPALVTLTRTGPMRHLQTWEANPYWIQPTLHRKGGPMPNYLTLRGGPREVELGAFLTEDERRSLCAEMQEVLRRNRDAMDGQPGTPP